MSESYRILSVSLDLTWLNRCCLLKHRLWSLLAAAASLQKCQSLQPAASSCSWEEVTAPSSTYFVGAQKTHFGSGLLHKQPLPVMVYCKISIVRDDQEYANFHSMSTHERRIQYIILCLTSMACAAFWGQKLAVNASLGARNSFCCRDRIFLELAAATSTLPASVWRFGVGSARIFVGVAVVCV